MSCDYTIESTISNLMEKGIADLATMNLESASDLMIIATCAFIVVFIAADIIMKLINVASLAAMLVIDLITGRARRKEYGECTVITGLADSAHDSRE